MPNCHLLDDRIEKWEAKNLSLSEDENRLTSNSIRIVIWWI